jgi:hypothetical protein
MVKGYENKQVRPFAERAGALDHAPRSNVRGGKAVVMTGDIKFGAPVRGLLRLGGAPVAASPPSRRPAAFVSGEAVFAPAGLSDEVAQELIAIKQRVEADMSRSVAPSRSIPRPVSPSSRLYDPERRPSYTKVWPWGVPNETRRAAREALDTAMAELGLKNITIEWFEDRTAEGGFSHHTAPNRLWLRASLSPELAALAARHEAAHLKQFRLGRTDRAVMEAEAEAFAEAGGWA